MSLAPPFVATTAAARPDHARPDHARPAARGGRDGAVDLARAWCLVVVVLLHALMVGVSVGVDGPVLENALDGWSGLPALTWLLQVMPLFFVLGGFSSFTQWSRLREAGGRYGDYLAGRVRRLLTPAVAAAAAAALVLAALAVAGVPAEVVAAAGFRLSQPLWFLGVYVLCTVAVPAFTALHRRAPVTTLAGIGAAAVAVDVVRAVTGVSAVGFANLLFVWLTVQQLGFWLADGRFAGPGRRRLLGAGAAAFCALVVLCACGVWSPDLLQNLNPPTAALLALAAVQLAGFELLRPLLRRAATRPAVASTVRAVGERAMTIYSWHMLALIGLAGGLLLAGVELPVPRSPEWWLSRPLWLLAVTVAVTAVVAVAGRVETRRVATRQAETRRPGQRPSAARALSAAAAGAGGVLSVLVSGGTPGGWVVGAASLFGALRILRLPSDDGAGTR